MRIDVPADKDKLQPIMVGESANLQVGQKVYAIGNPFGLDQSLTTGIVSALEREIESVTRRAIRGVIQTDAAINPGNSGGPLLDSAGRLIGVNTAIYSPSGANAGIGFAIPVDEVNRVVPRLIRDGRLVRPTLGVEAAPAAVGKPLGLPDGVVVVGVVPGSAAAAAGIRPFTRAADGSLVVGDVITAVDGERSKASTTCSKRSSGVSLATWSSSMFGALGPRLRCQQNSASRSKNHRSGRQRLQSAQTSRTRLF